MGRTFLLRPTDIDRSYLVMASRSETADTHLASPRPTSTTPFQASTTPRARLTLSLGFSVLPPPPRSPLASPTSARASTYRRSPPAASRTPSTPAAAIDLSSGTACSARPSSSPANTSPARSNLLAASTTQPHMTSLTARPALHGSVGPSLYVDALMCRSRWRKLAHSALPTSSPYAPTAPLLTSAPHAPPTHSSNSASTPRSSSALRPLALSAKRCKTYAAFPPPDPPISCIARASVCSPAPSRIICARSLASQASLLSASQHSTATYRTRRPLSPSSLSPSSSPSLALSLARFFPAAPGTSTESQPPPSVSPTSARCSRSSARAHVRVLTTWRDSGTPSSQPFSPRATSSPSISSSLAAHSRAMSSYDEASGPRPTWDV
eukprot:1789394-Rhodomonas_salina.3